MNDKQVRGQYTQEFKLESVRLVKTGQSVGMTAKVLGIPKACINLPRNLTSLETLWIRTF